MEKKNKYLHLFNSDAEYQDARANKYWEPWVSLTKWSDDVKFDKSEEEILFETPLTFEIISDGVIKWYRAGTMEAKTIEYKKNDGDWTEITSASGESTPTISVVSGDTVQFRGNNTGFGRDTGSYTTFSGTTAGFNLKGNIMSLLDKFNFPTMTAFPTQGSGTFHSFFQNCRTLVDISKLKLPAKVLRGSSYYRMFQGCSSLVSVPDMRATTMASSSCLSMFNGCTSLTNAGSLTLGASVAYCCYQQMFYGCSSLVEVPKMPQETLSSSCYYSMFAQCTSLVTVPKDLLPATTTKSSCYFGMFQGCSNLVTVPDLPATTIASDCYNGMFQNCSKLTTAPDLPAATLAYQSYQNMFNGTKVNRVKCLATNISASNCTRSWLNASSTGTFIKHPDMNDWSRNTSGIPTNWTVEDAVL